MKTAEHLELVQGEIDQEVFKYIQEMLKEKEAEILELKRKLRKLQKETAMEA